MQKLSMAQLGRKTIEEYKDSPKKKIIVILDNIRSMHNVGSVFRTSDAFLIEAIYLCGFTPPPPHRDINKTALGATETVDWKYFENTIDAVNHVKQNGFKVFAIEQATESVALNKMDNTIINIGIILGNEVEGVSNEVLQICDGCIEIPQLGMKHSLNVSVAAAIVLWQLVWGK